MFSRDKNDQLNFFLFFFGIMNKLKIFEKTKQTINPLTFHHNQDISLKKIQHIILESIPKKKEIHIFVPFALLFIKPTMKTPKTGPLIKELTLLIATSTLFEMSST